MSRQGGCGYLLVARSELAEVAIVVSPHLHVKDFGFGHLRLRNEDFLKKVEDVLADPIQLSFDHLAVLVNKFDVLAASVGFSVLDGRDGSPSSTAASHAVFVRN